MRGGTYGWQAAERGCFGVCFTNTLPNLPAWGTAHPVLGNNPLVFAVPRPNGAHVVLDMAMSQYSYGALDSYANRGEPLPFPGGFDEAGNLTTDAAAIRKSWRALPIGLWKGSGLALMLDLFAALLSGGQATHDLPHDAMREAGISQFFLAIDPRTFADVPALEQAADAILSDLTSSEPLEAGKPVRYPGEQTLHLREENLRLGVPVDEALWRKLQAGTI
jgi:3-dehydro-L-gulonate 2-dehydrogenase